LYYGYRTKDINNFKCKEETQSSRIAVSALTGLKRKTRATDVSSASKQPMLNA